MTLIKQTALLFSLSPALACYNLRGFNIRHPIKRQLTRPSLDRPSIARPCSFPILINWPCRPSRKAYSFSAVLFSTATRAADRSRTVSESCWTYSETLEKLMPWRESMRASKTSPQGHCRHPHASNAWHLAMGHVRINCWKRISQFSKLIIRVCSIILVWPIQNWNDG